MPPGFVDEVVVGGLPFPTAIAFTPDDRMFIALKAGIVRVYQNGQLLPTPFIDIASRVHDNHDRGLLGHHGPPATSPPRPTCTCCTPTTRPACSPTASIRRARAQSTPRPHGAAPAGRGRPATGSRRPRPGTEIVLLGTNSTAPTIGAENDGRNTAFATCMNPKTHDR